jgi:hypothetical protein
MSRFWLILATAFKPAAKVPWPLPGDSRRNRRLNPAALKCRSGARLSATGRFRG